jgi:hypothetical protein
MVRPLEEELCSFLLPINSASQLSAPVTGAQIYIEAVAVGEASDEGAKVMHLVPEEAEQQFVQMGVGRWHTSLRGSERSMP